MAHKYPATRQADVTDDFHGTLIGDPYRWLEDPDSTETQAWVEAQNETTLAYLRQLPQRQALLNRLEELWNYPRWTAPIRRKERLFFTKNDGLQDQPVLFSQIGLEGEPSVLLDPNTLTEDGTAALVGSTPNKDGTLVAINIAESGSDWQTISVLDVENGRHLDDRIKQVKFTSVAWMPDSTGFYYARFPTRNEVPDAAPSTNQKVYFHSLGTAQASDELVYERPDAPDLGFMPYVSNDGHYLVLHVWEGTDTRNRLYYRPIDGDAEFSLLLDNFDARYEFIEHVNGRFLVLTDLGAPLGRVVSIDLANPGRDAWDEVIPEGDDALVHAGLIGGRLITLWLHHAHHVIRVYDERGNLVDEPALPGIGSIVEFSGGPDDPELFLGYQSFTEPPTVLRYVVDTTNMEPVWAPKVSNLSGFHTEQTFATSLDGTRIPMFLISRADLEPDASTPLVLYGYGGFDISLTPTYQPARLAFIEAGGTFVVANLRGGAEYGQAWHQAGMLEKKQNVFDDFISCAEHLIDTRVTSKDHLGILGGSNGGLLVATAELQRPDLFGAAVPMVPVADMLRYHRFTAGRYWTPEYGNAEETKEHFEFLIEYSPIHNVADGVRYPPTLITTADTDDRVVPMHSYKLAATMQTKSDASSPVFLRVETRAGHGLGKPTSKVIEEAADIYAFFLHHLS